MKYIIPLLFSFIMCFKSYGQSKKLFIVKEEVIDDQQKNKGI